MDHFKQGNHQQKIPKMRVRGKVVLYRPWKVDLFIAWEVKQGCEVLLCLPLARNVCWVTQIFYCSMHVCEWSQKCHNCWFTNMESVNNEDYTHAHLWIIYTYIHEYICTHKTMNKGDFINTYMPIHTCTHTDFFSVSAFLSRLGYTESTGFVFLVETYLV